MTTLPSLEEGSARAREARAALDEFARDHGHRVFNWLVLPRLATLIDTEIAGEQAPLAEVVPDWQLRRIRRGQRRVKIMREGEEATAAVGGRVVFMAANDEMRRSQAAAREHFAGTPRSLTRVGVKARAQRFTKRASEFSREFMGAMQRAGVALPFDGTDIIRIWLRAAGQLAFWERALDEEDVGAVVTGTTAGPRGRAMIAAARRHGIPSAYIPHAPILGDARRNDLPVDFAGLRSAREADLIAAAGAPRERIEVIGDPIPVHAERPARSGQGNVLLIAPPYPQPVIAAVIEVVAEACGGEVTLAVQPGGGEEAAELAPAGWDAADEPIAELFARGPAAVIQHSGEFAAEAMRLGLPVIELEFPGRETTYPILETEHVRRASDSDALREAVASAREDSGDEIAAWAAEWASPAGAEAGERSIKLVQSALETSSPPGPIWDSWDPSGVGPRTAAEDDPDDEDEDDGPNS